VPAEIINDLHRKTNTRHLRVFDRAEWRESRIYYRRYTKSIRRHTGNAAEMDERVATAIRIMRRRVSDDISFDAVARTVNLSQTRLRQLFVQEVGQPPSQYLKHLRMQRAQYLLGTTFLSIKQVTHLVGINDASHFVRDFKNKYGLTPSSFRANLWGRKCS
jgi:transcriptional regulator GlxA family with amidase domain